jgi:type II secretory pathway pseudopilin PulG
MTLSKKQNAFTLIELITVIAIIMVLMGLLFPAIGTIKESARKAQAKNDEANIVTAVKAYYTEYGKYPLKANKQGVDTLYGDPNGQYDNFEVFDVLRATASNGSLPSPNVADAMNPRKVVFFEATNTKSATNPKSGILTKDSKDPRPSGATMNTGGFVDPWGAEYLIAIDGNYDNYDSDFIPYSDVTYTSVGGYSCLPIGVFVESYGKDLKIGTNGANKLVGSDDVVSFQ